MTLFEKLKEFNKIAPDPSYTEKSRRIIFASPQREPLGVRQVVVRIFEAAGSLALAGVLVFAIAGGFSDSRYLSPVPFQGIDPVALHAEAQAIDMQINLADLNYTESLNTTQATAIAPPAKVPFLNATSSSVGGGSAAEGTSTSTANGAVVATSTATSSAISINEALQQLEQ